MRFRRVSLKEQLARVPLFEDLSEVDLDHVARLAVRVRQPAGEILIKEAEPGNEFLIVVEGQVEVVHDDRAVTTLGPGDFLGEVALLDARAKRTATVTARTPVTIAFVSAEELVSRADVEMYTAKRRRDRVGTRHQRPPGTSQHLTHT
jgi:CRP-like cAMP-binding protein